MATGRISLYDHLQKHAISLLPGITPLHDSTLVPWKGLKLEHYRVADSERQEVTTNSYLIALCLDGHYETEYFGMGSSPGIRVNLRPGSVFLSGPARLPARRSKGEIEFLVMELAPKYVMWAADELAIATHLEIRPMWWGKEQQVRHVMMILQQELLAGCPSGPLLGEYIGLTLATMLLTRHAAEPARLVYRGGLPHYKLRQVLALIDDNLASGVSARQMANLVELGPCHFTRAFKVSTGLSPHQYVLRRRIERALDQLKQSKVSLADLAYKLGFSSQGHFTTVFHKIVGVAPHTYQEQMYQVKDVQISPSVSQAASNY